MKRNFRKLLPPMLAALLLTACGDKYYGADYGKRNDAYLRYAFGEDYTLTFTENREDDDGKETEWLLCYQRADGTPHEIRMETYDYEEMSTHFSYGTQEEFDDYWLYYYVSAEAAQNGCEDLFSKIVSQYYSVGENASFIQPAENVYIGCYCRFPLLQPGPLLHSCRKQALDPQSGLNVRGADLQSIAEDRTMILNLYTRIDDPAADAAPYVEAMTRIYEDYLAAVRSPENYSFSVLQKTGAADDGSDGYQILFARSALTGIGEFDAETRYGTFANSIDAMRDELIDILEKQPK